MNKYTINFEQLFNLTKIYSDYLSGGLRNYYRYNFRDTNSARKAAMLIDSKEINRQKLYQICYDNNKRLGASEKTLKNIELLRNQSTLCVFSGQQTAVCSSPMYVIYKALTSVRLAQKYQKILNRPVVPCFWMATDDHDFEEVRNASFLLRSGKVFTASYRPDSDPSGLPISEIVLDDGINNFHESLNEALIDTEFKRQMVRVIQEFYKPGSKLSDAFAGVFNCFLGDRGIILVDPNFKGLKEFFKPVFIKEVLAHDQTFEIYKQRSKDLTDNGYHMQVHKTGDNLNLFYHTPSRLNLVRCEEEYCCSDSSERFSPQHLNEIAENFPERFSSNVLLRPVTQCCAFPTLCQVVGPSELAYYAQIEPLFEYFDVPFPIVYPRSGMTIVEPHIRKIIYKYDIAIPELHKSLDRLIGEVIEKFFPSEAAGALPALSERIKNGLDEFTSSLKKSDPESYQYITNFHKHCDFEIKQLQKKLKTSNKKRHDEIISQVRKSYSFLFPDNKLQERVLSPLYFANKFGKDIFKYIYDNLEVEKPVHTILEL